MSQSETKRIYPSCCTSAYCGSGSDKCPTCPNWPRLKEFNDWVERTGAKPACEIWSPNVYVIPKGA